MNRPVETAIRDWSDGPVVRTVVTSVVRPVVFTILAMAIAFAVVSGLLFAIEGVVLANLVTRLLSLGVMLIVPHFVVGVWIGTRDGVVGLAIAAMAMTPIALLAGGLLAFGGPLDTILANPLFTLTGVFGWAFVALMGMVVGRSYVAQSSDYADTLSPT